MAGERGKKELVTKLLFSPFQCVPVAVDRGCRGHGIKDAEVLISGRKRGVTTHMQKVLKRGIISIRWSVM
jgi:hypothetical protein